MNRVDAVLDTVSCQHLVRRPQRRIKRAGRETSIDAPIAKKRLRLAFDKSGGILDEWCRTFGSDTVGVLLSKWEPQGGVVFIDDPAPVPRATMRKLLQLGFTNTIDKLVLRVGLCLGGRRIVTDDSDFWRPGDPNSRGDPNAPVAKICRDELCARIMLLQHLLQELAAL